VNCHIPPNLLYCDYRPCPVEYRRKEKILMTDAKQIALLYAKEITVAKLSQSAPSRTNEDVGALIGSTYEAIYRKIYELASEEDKKEE